MFNKLKLKYVPVLCITVLGFIIVTSFLRPSADTKVSAAYPTISLDDINNATFTMVDGSHIIGKVGTQTFLFTDSVPNDGNSTFESPGASCSTNATIKISPSLKDLTANPAGNTLSANVYIPYRTNPDLPTCASPPVIVKSVGGINMRGSFFYKSSDKQITGLQAGGAGSGTYTQTTQNTNLYIRDSEAGKDCQDEILVSGNTARLYELATESEKGNFDSPPFAPDDAGVPTTTCYLLAVSVIYNTRDSNITDVQARINSGFYNFPFITDPEVLKILGGVPGGGGDTPGGGKATAKARNSCTNVSAEQGLALRFILCPFIEIMDGILNWLDNNIQSQLITPDYTKVGDNRNDDLHTAWGRLRNVALIVLFPIMLLMVVGTALQVSFLDPYTVRKAMPRFLIAIVFISVSWYITGFFINLTNAIGTGVLGLMTQPFQGGGFKLKDLIDVSGSVTTGIASLPVLGALVVNGTVTFGVIASIAFAGALALLVGFLILTLRQLLIIACVLTAPLAILGWIFPGSDKIWKIWKETFSGLLLMFPLIMMAIGASKIFAFIIARLQ